MKTEKDHLQELSEIKQIMEQSTRFISLSGISGVLAGLSALAGILAAYLYMQIGISSRNYYHLVGDFPGKDHPTLLFLMIDAMAVLVLALVSCVYFTTRNARRRNLPVWNPAVKKMLIHLFIPLIAGGLFCLILVYYRLIFMVAPAMLIFYGLALMSASKYTLRDIWHLGMIQSILGLAACCFPGYGLLFWAFGFGILHIVYGLLVYYKYER